MKPRKLFAAPLVAGLVLALAACGGSPASTSSTTAQKASGWDINETDRANLREGGEFRGSVEELAPNWNPWSVEGNNSDYSAIRDAITAQFFDYDSTGKAIANPDFIADVKAESNPNTVVTMKMNDKAVWGDGQPIVAADWIATWKANNGSNKEFRVVTTQGWDALTDVKQGANDREVIFTFKDAYPDWTQFMSDGPLRAESVATPQIFNSGWGDLKNEWFSGAFKVDKVDKTQKIVTLVPNDKWWGNKPLLSKITWRAITVEAVASAFESNEIDYFDIGIDADAYNRANGVADASIRKAPGPNFRHFTFNSKGGFLTDEKVRQAVVMGLDRKAIAASDLAGLDWSPDPLNNNVFMANQNGYEDMAAKTGIDFNVAKAKQLLEEAGWKMNDSTSFYEKDGKPLVVRFKQLTGVKASENEALQAKTQLKAIGVDLKIESVPPSDFDDKLLTQGDWDIIAFSWIGTPYPFTSIRQLYGTGQESNYAKLSIDGLDDLLTKIDKEGNDGERIKLANQAAEKIWTAVHTLPLYQRPAFVAVKSSLANYGSFGFGSAKWENVGYVK